MTRSLSLPIGLPVRLARQVLAECGVTEPPVSEARILRYFGIDLDQTPFAAVPRCERLEQLPNRVQGVLVKESDSGSPVIWVDPTTSPGRRRWTIFHEVAHYDIPWHEALVFTDDDRALRPADGRPGVFPTSLRESGYQGVLQLGTDGGVAFAPVMSETLESRQHKRQEREANQYAAELIMPGPMFFAEARALPIGVTTIDGLATRYAASFEATAIRYAHACPERCAVFAAEPISQEDGSTGEFEVIYATHTPRFLVGLRQGLRFPICDLLAEAWSTKGPVNGSVAAEELGLGSRLTLSADALKLGQYDRVVTMLWLSSGQLSMMPEGGHL